MENVLNINGYRKFLSEAAGHYDRSRAPTVATYIEDLYIRIGDNPAEVRLSELHVVSGLWEDGTWEQPNYAANRIYKLMDSLAMDTTGHAGF